MNRKILTSRIHCSLVCIFCAIFLYGCPDDQLCDHPDPTWKASQSFDANLWATGVFFTDENNIWISAIPIPDAQPVPDLPVTILKSSNGGSTWTKITIPGTNKMVASPIFPLDGNTAWIDVYGKGLYKTSDGGLTWNIINSTSVCKAHMGRPHFFNQNDGIKIGFYDHTGLQNDSIKLFSTTDGGATWTQIASPDAGNKLAGEQPGAGISSIFCAKGDTVAFCTSFGRVFMSYNRGISWKVVSYGSAPYEFFHTMAMESSKKFVVISWSKTYVSGDTITYGPSTGHTAIIATKDGGITWLSPYVPLIQAQGYDYISFIPGLKDTYVYSLYRMLSTMGGTWITTNQSLSFAIADENIYNMGPTAFWSSKIGIGASFNSNVTSGSKINYIYKWSDETLACDGILPL